MAESTPKLYGECRTFGECTCGMCDDIANNRNSGTSSELYDCEVCPRMHVKGHDPHEPKASVAPDPTTRRIDKHCAVCGKIQRSNHSCQGDRKPTGHPSLQDMDTPSPAVLARRAERKNESPQKPTVPLTSSAPVAEYPLASEPLRKPVSATTLPCEVCGADVTLEGSEKIMRRRAYCHEHYPKPELPKEITVEDTTKRIVIEVGDVRITIEPVDK